MKTFILTLVLLFLCSPVFAGYVEVGGYYTPITKIASGVVVQQNIGNVSGLVVWTPASGRKIVLMGIFTCPNTHQSGSDIITFETDWSSRFLTGTPITPPYLLVSGPIVIGNGVPIWEGAVDGTISVKVENNRWIPSILLWGYEK